MESQPGSVSVALCTYNGARFLEPQLQSILQQTRLPDEVVAVDDGSRDATLTMLERYAAAAPFTVRIIRNATNLGSTRNFEKAIRACEGEFIALCDQDDVWRKERLRRSVSELEAHPGAGLAFTDGEIIDDDGRHVGKRLWENFAFHPVSRDRLSVGDFIPMARRRFVTGATVIFRSKFRDYCFPVGEHWVHDGWLTAIIACMSGVRMISEPLIDYRMHSAQQIGLGPRPIKGGRADSALRARRHWSSFVNVLEDLNILCDRLDQLPLTEAQRTTGPARGFYTQRNFLAMRLGLPENRIHRVPVLWQEREHYKECAMGWLSMLKDLRLHKQGTYEPMWDERLGYTRTMKVRTEDGIEQRKDADQQ